MTVRKAKEGFTFGCDPEVFVTRKEGGKDIPVSAAGLLPGTKDSPYPVEYGAVQVDGMAAEFNIEPASTFEEFDRNISEVYRQLEAMLPEGHSLLVAPAVVFSEEEFDKAPDESKALGCMPDFDAWTGLCNPPPQPENPFLRCAAGHLHLGWTEDAPLDDLQHILNCQDVVKQLDWFLGAWSINKDSDPRRRELYGKAGACRFKPYGVEYRVLSNFWIKSRATRVAVWNRTMKAIDQMATAFLPDYVSSFDNEIIRQAINTTTLSTDVKEDFRYPVMTTNPNYFNY